MINTSTGLTDTVQHKTRTLKKTPATIDKDKCNGNFNRFNLNLGTKKNSYFQVKHCVNWLKDNNVITFDIANYEP